MIILCNPSLTTSIFVFASEGKVDVGRGYICHCTTDSALLPSHLPSLHSHSFNEMIFILVPPVFFRAVAQSQPCACATKYDYPFKKNKQKSNGVLYFHGGKFTLLTVSCEKHKGSSIKRHIACPTKPIYVKLMVSICSVGVLDCFLEK